MSIGKKNLYVIFASLRIDVPEMKFLVAIFHGAVALKEGGLRHVIVSYSFYELDG